MKEQARNTEVQVNEEEIGKLLEKEFRIKMIKNLEKKWRKAGQPWKQGNTAESWVGGGAITITSLSPPDTSIGSSTIETDPLNA